MERKEGFPGQLSYVVPEKVLKKIRQNPLIKDLYITDIGFYPNASHHQRTRKTGTSQYILIYNVSGSGYIKLGGITYNLSPDHFFIIPPNIPHSYYADKKDPWSIYWIHISGGKAKLLLKPDSTAIPIERIKTSRINARLELFHEIFNNLERGYNMEILEYVNLCLTHLLASFSHVKQYRSINDPLNNDPVNLAINYMLENITTKLNLKQIASEVNLSTTYFSRLFVKDTGFSPIEYFINLRIQHACHLLENKTLSILDVAHLSGFDDQFYFSRLFKKVMNTSPRNYRASRVI